MKDYVGYDAKVQAIYSSQNIVDFDQFSYADMVILSTHIQELRQLTLSLRMQVSIALEFFLDP